MYSNSQIVSLFSSTNLVLQRKSHPALLCCHLCQEGLNESVPPYTKNR